MVDVVRMHKQNDSPSAKADLEAQVSEGASSKSKAVFKNLFSNPLETLFESKGKQTAAVETMEDAATFVNHEEAKNLELGQGFGQVEVVER
eukprot:CAMPEP_0170497858 /NCGR_PEP_ID=MMETSP0208-20121228/26055_1 /TAXON_ID=197538 /ORGANISM="Strombidium inclinatum, Strain S3" /LENGTH=90 /DNA_ID=CAMNT_0010774809 /DNA_START=15 /DNA_END=287 /DNA_ORIENTATION=-